jgi:hypothetical protein
VQVQSRYTSVSIRHVLAEVVATSLKSDLGPASIARHDLQDLAVPPSLSSASLTLILFSLTIVCADVCHMR